MLKIVPFILEAPYVDKSWSIVDDSTGEYVGDVKPESVAVFLEMQKETVSREIGMKEIRDEKQTNMEEEASKIMLAESEGEMRNLRIPLNEKRFLDIAEFQQYTSLGKNRAADLARTSGCIFRFGRRKMVDRKKFDEWCDSQ